MIKKMLSTLPADRDVWVMTFRENDEKGKAPRALYKSLGFTEGELLYRQAETFSILTSLLWARSRPCSSLQWNVSSLAGIVEHNYPHQKFILHRAKE